MTLAPAGSSPAPTGAPLIETARLTMRGHRRADFDDSFALWADLEVTRFVGGRASTREESWSRLLRYGGLWPMLGFGYWVVHERASGRFVGEVGFADFLRDMTPSLGSPSQPQQPEAGWVLAQWAHGRGFASEAIGAALAWLDDSPHRGRSVCIIAPPNIASIRVAEKAGYRLFAQGSYKENAVSCFERPAPGAPSLAENRTVG